MFAEVLDSELCDCADQLRLALCRFTREGHGLLVYLRLDGRGAGLAAKVRATELEVRGVDTFDSREAIGVRPESRDFSAIGAYLWDRGLRRIRLLTNNPDKARAIRAAGVEVTMEPLIVHDASAAVKRLLETKVRKFGHQIPGYSASSASPV